MSRKIHGRFEPLIDMLRSCWSRVSSGLFKSILGAVGKLVASDTVDEFEAVLKPVLVLDNTVELVTEDGDVGGDLHDSRAWE